MSTQQDELFVRTQSRSLGEQLTRECAFVWRGLPAGVPLPVSPLRFGWTATAKSLLERIHRNALRSERPEGNEIPYADLRAALQARVGGMLLLESWILPRNDNAPLFAATGAPSEILAATHRLVAAWAQLTLRPWVERLGADCGDVDLFETRARQQQLFEQRSTPHLTDEGRAPDALRSDFHQFSDILLAIVASSLEGAELFPGLGPVYRLLDRDYGNTIAFETWPTSLPGKSDLFSMVAEVSVETRPSSRLPLLVVRAAKRIWCNEFPTANDLFGRRRISVRVVTRSSVARAATLTVRVGRGVPTVNLDAIVHEAGRNTDVSLTGDLPDLIKSRGRMPDLFVGVPFRHGYSAAPKIPFGVTLQDQVDLTSAVKERIASFGFAESRLRLLNSRIERSEEFHLQATLYNLITHHFGRVTEEELPSRVEQLFGSPESKARGKKQPIKTVDLEPMVLANRERLDKAFGKDCGIDLIFICRREQEAHIFRSVVALLFGDRINVVRHAMPAGVHGARQDLDGEIRHKRMHRAALRREAWTPLATQIRDEFPNSPVIVQAALKYDGRNDDKVNKDVGRNTLATIAGCNVQYLLPPAAGKAAEYMHRVQAALYDLLFGHAGLGPVLANLVASTFGESNRPRSIVGLSVISQAATRTGRPNGATLAAAMKIDIATGRISGRFGSVRNGAMNTGLFQTLSKTLIGVASAGRTSLGDTQPDCRMNFLSFVRAVVDEVAAEDPHALILVESTTARSLWPWLSDENISSDLYLDDPTVRAPSSWKGLRFVRVRERSAGRLAVEARRRWMPVNRDGNSRAAEPVDEIYATATERLAESLPEGNARARHYLTAHGFDVRNRGARGQSVYRSKDGFQKAGPPKSNAEYKNKVLWKRATIAPWDVPSRIPVTLEVTVLPTLREDEADATATLVAALRNGYSHTADGTFLPAPLSFKSKILDYMDRYASETEDDDPEDDRSVDEPELPEESDVAETAIGYGETRRWYEGSSEFGEKDIPPFEDESGDSFQLDQVALDNSPLREHNPQKPGEEKSMAIATLEPLQPAVATTSDASYPGGSDYPDGSDDLGALVRLLRSPSAPLPSFVTEEFLADAMHVVNSDAREIHQDREWIRTVTGFPWPEERPAAYDFPGLYLDALRYPAFAIAFQHQFFPDEKERGLPKRAILLKNRDFLRRIRKEKPIPKGEADLSVLCSLHALDNGGDQKALLADILALPGQAAWRSPCARASAGLDRLEGRQDECAELGRYLRAVVGPFAQFGDDRTIGEVLQDVIIPYVRRNPDATSQPPSKDDAVCLADTPIEAAPDETAGPSDSAAGPTLEEVLESWQHHCDQIAKLAFEARSSGPDGDATTKLATMLAGLEALQAKAALLRPSEAPTDEIKEAIRSLTAQISDALTSLIGEPLSVPTILLQLFKINDQVPVADLDTASSLRRDAELAFSEARSLANEIESLEGSLPIKLARQRTEPLIDAQEAHLRRALELIAGAVRLLATEGTPVAATPSSAASPEPHPEEPPEGPLVHSEASVALEDDLDVRPEDEALAVEEPHEEDPHFTSVLEATNVVLPAQPPVDPLYQELTKRLDHLFSLGEHGLAYHLRTAAMSVIPPSERNVYTPVELRLAAATGRTVGLSTDDLQALSELTGEALSVAQSLYGFDDDRSRARLTLLFPGALSSALFRSDDPAAIEVIKDIGRQDGYRHYEKLVQAVEENRKLNFPLTPANLLAIEAHSREATFVSESIESIKETIAGLRSARFRFQTGERIRHALTRPQGVLGQLESRIAQADHTSAREVADLFQSRDKTASFVAKLVEEFGGGGELDGPGRERIFGALSRLGQQCHHLLQSVEGFDVLRRNAGRLETVKRLRDLALTGISEALSYTPQAEFGLLTESAVRQGNRILEASRNILQGVGASGREAAPLAVGLHTPLLWLPGLTWTGGWRPSPYVPEKILQEALNAPVPLIGQNPTESIHQAFEARRSESAFVPAYMLLNVAHWFGVSSQTTDGWRAKLDADKEAKKHQVSLLLGEAERTIDRMRRMAVGSLEQSARLKEMLSTIKPSNLPVELPPTFLPETLTGDRIEDFNSALARIREVETEAQREFDKSQNEYASSIEDLDRKGKLDTQTRLELLHLLERREFTTLADRLILLRGDEVRNHPLLASGPLNWRLANFKSVLPQLGAVDLLQVGRAIDLAKAYGPLDYSLLDEDRRQEARSVTRAFPNLKPTKNASTAQIAHHVTEVVSRLLYEVTKCVEEPTMTRRLQQIFVFDATVSLPPPDPASLLLPEFGSLTQGSWRICVVTPAIPQETLLSLGDGAGHRGVLVLYRGVLNAERRQQLRIEMIRRKRTMLIVDEALVAYAIADSEDPRRAIIEIAQAYSSADPYRDHGKSAVPPEMFKGRTLERNAILEPFGSYVVFGGRRLGKTALLQQIHATQPPHAVFAYVDLDMVNDTSDDFEQISRRVESTVFKSSVRTAEEFSSTITSWLNADDRRRILLLIDEADNFVRKEVENGFPCIQTLLQLMAETKHRFKFVLAGLHNVSRMVRAENSPLVQIASSPLKIGPLLNRDVGDAEFLVRGPLAAMGFEFEKREDVWRILTFTNYYPVLIQVFCQELLRLIHDHAQKTGQVPATINTVLVERALSSSDVRSKLFATFEATIGSIERRYELLTYILAVRELVERDSGMTAEGMTAAEVAERAMAYWPAAFPRGTDPNELEYLLEEMEGFGIARRTVAGSFALRSRSLLELMAATEDDLSRKLESYKNLRAPPKPFDPKNYRRQFGKPMPGLETIGRVSPLTDGQEADLLAPFNVAVLDGNDDDPRPSSVGVVFGTECAGIKFVEAALLDAKRVKDKLVDVEVKTYESKKDMLDDAKRGPKPLRPKVIVVSHKTAWRPDWVVEAERAGRIRKGDLRMIFIGGPEHAGEWSRDRLILNRVLPQIKIVKLRPWARSYLGNRIESLHLPGEHVDGIFLATGGWSQTAGPLLSRIAERPGHASAAIRSMISDEKEAVLKSPDLLERLGIPAEPELMSFFKDLAAYSDGSTVTTADFQYLSTDGRNVHARAVGIYADLLGILSFPPDPSGQGHRKVDLNPLVHAALLRAE